MAITAKVRNKQIDTGKVLHVLVQGENASGNITFRILGEEELMEDINSTYFYLLYTRPSDTHANVLLLTGKQIVDDAIEVTFKPTSYFTAEDGTVQIQIMATDTEGLSVDSETGTVSGSIIWQTFPSAMFVHASQLNGTETIIEENVLTQYLGGMQELYTATESAADGVQEAAEDAGESAEAATASADDAEEYASDAQDWTEGDRSDGKTVKHANTNAKKYASDAKEWATGQRDDSRTPTHTTENAQYYAGQAGNAADKAEDWAEEAHDTPVEPGKYSAKHWATEAAGSASSADADADTATAKALISEGYAVGEQGGTPVGSGTYFENNAKYYAGQASQKATAAGQSKTAAETAAANAEKWAEKMDGAVEPDKYSAKYWADYAEQFAEDYVKYDDNEVSATLPINADQLNGHTDTYFAIRTQAGATLELHCPSDSYILTAKLKNSAGTVISQAVVDLPAEYSVVGGRFDSNTKNLYLQIRGGGETPIPLAALISGLATQADFSAHTGNENIHIIAAERTAWNSHMQDSDMHINATERLNWNNHKDDPDVHVTTTDKARWDGHVADNDIHVTATEHGNYNSHLANSDVHVTTTNKSTWNAKYDKPSGGIPLEDLTAALQTAYAYALAGITYDDAVSA